MSASAAARKPVPASAKPPAKPSVKSASAAQPAARPRNPASSKPNLRLVPRSGPRFRKLYFASFLVGLVALVVTPFAIVFLHVSLLTGQRQLDDLRLDLNQQLELRQQLLYDRSQAISPERIRDIAIDELGMVPAESITYLQAVRSGADG